MKNIQRNWGKLKMPRKIDNSKLSFGKFKRVFTEKYFRNQEKKLQKTLIRNSNAIDWSSR